MLAVQCVLFVNVFCFLLFAVNCKLHVAAENVQC